MIPTPTMLPSPVDVWRHAIEVMPADRSPCARLTPAHWAEMRAACLDFCDQFGAEALRLGWTASELFGVHPEHGTLRLEMCGALMVNGRKATGVEPGRVLLGNLSAYRGKAGQAWGPPVWEFTSKGRR